MKINKKKSLKICTRSGGRDNIYILVESGNFGAVSTDDNSTYKYYIFKYVSIIYTMKYETIIDVKVIIDV